MSTENNESNIIQKLVFRISPLQLLFCWSLNKYKAFDLFIDLFIYLLIYCSRNS